MLFIWHCTVGCVQCHSFACGGEKGGSPPQRKNQIRVVGRYTFYDDQLIDGEFLPVIIKDYSQPHILKGEEKRVILEEMQEESLHLSLAQN